jgi:hypothetical protein
MTHTIQSVVPTNKTLARRIAQRNTVEGRVWGIMARARNASKKMLMVSTRNTVSVAFTCPASLRKVFRDFKVLWVVAW